MDSDATQSRRSTAHRTVTGDCGFPGCDRDPVTPRGMCDQHRRVLVSDTGSWLEAG